MAGYVPVVKSKSNDLDAIARLRVGTLGKIKPLVEPPVVVENGAASTDVAKAATQAHSRLPSIPYYFDPLGFEAEFRQLSAIRQMAEERRACTPTFGLHRLPKNQKALGDVLNEFGLALALRVDLRDFREVPDEVWERLISYAGQIGLRQDRVELLLDLQHVDPRQEKQLVEDVLDFLWLQPKGFAPKDVTLLGSSAPASVADIELDGQLAIRRRERDIWAGVNFELDGTRLLGFGDYGVVNPKFAFSGPNPNANAKIRYASGAHHQIFRGHALYNPNRFEQYFELAKRVVDSKEFAGSDFSFGDQHIAACAERKVGPGNLGTWVKVDTNHHIEVVGRQTDFILRNMSLASSSAELQYLLVEA